jgi:phytoene dehydrogenase-like protein
MGEYDTAVFTDRYDLMKMQMRLKIKALITIKERILNRCLNFSIGVEQQHATQQKTVSFLQSAQNEVQNYFKNRSDDVYEKLQKANQFVDSDSSEDMSLLLTEIRRAIKAAADYFFPPETTPRLCIDGKERTFGDEQYLNRLHEYVQTTFPRSASSDLLRAEFDYLVVFARRLNDISSKGVHANVTAAEAKQGFLGLYLFLFNVCHRLDQVDA